TFASGMIADARISRIVETTSSSTNVNPRSPFNIRDSFSIDRSLPHRHRHRCERHLYRRAIWSVGHAIDANRARARSDGIEHERGKQTRSRCAELIAGARDRDIDTPGIRVNSWCKAGGHTALAHERSLLNVP